MRARQPLILSLLTLSVLALAGCSASPSWFRGDWVVDSDRTQKEMSASNPPQPTTNQGFLGNLANNVATGLNNAVGSMVVGTLSGMEFVVTDKDILSLHNGQGSSLTYEVVQKTSDSIMIKESDGNVETFYRTDGDEIYTCPSASDNLKVYFHRKTGS